MSFSKLTTSLVLLAVASATTQAAVINARQNCSSYKVDGIDGAFEDRTFVDFTTAADGADPNDFLGGFNMGVSNYNDVPSTPIPHNFPGANVAIANGALQLKVDAYDNSGHVNGGEVVTNDKFMYGSLRTVLKSSGVNGVCEGMFFYSSETQESDWEILTTTVSQPSADVPAGIWATNQAHDPNAESTHQVVPFTFDPSADYHEYRIDWTADATVFYIDGEEKVRLTENVPAEATRGIWNAWSSGDPQWSAGPNTEDSYTYIQSIDIYKGYIPDAKEDSCQV